MSQKKVTYLKLLYQLKKKMQAKRAEAKICVSDEDFTWLLAAIPSMMNGYDLFGYSVKEGIDIHIIKNYLTKQYQIKDERSAIQAIRSVLNDNTQWQYEQFYGFWKNHPEYNLEELDEQSKNFFENCKAFAKQFFPVLDDIGFAGFDFGEAVRLIRECYSCGFLTQEEADPLLQEIKQRAFQHFDSWEEFAISYISGGAYFMYRSSGMNGNFAGTMFQSYLKIVEMLFFDKRKGVWNKYAWLEGKKYFPKQRIHRRLIDSTLGCFVTDRISVDQMPIGYFVREEASKNHPDSGWRFFAGDETQAYIDQDENTQVFTLNTVCNYDADIIPFLKMPQGTVVVRKEDGMFYVEEKKENDEN